MKCAPRDPFADRYLSGGELWGDRFSEEEIAEWYNDEREAYADLGASSSGAESYGYHGVNRYHGFQRLPKRRFSHALGVGSAFGGEFIPMLRSIDRVTILEPSARLHSADLGVNLTYIAPDPSGSMPFGNGTFDLLLCLGVLHHIPNVTHVVSEIGRVLEPGGWAVIREPVISMGDWRSTRKAGITRRERGIPRHILEQAVRNADMKIHRSRFCMSPLTPRIGRMLHRNLYATEFGAAIDRALSLSTAWNYRYHAESTWQKLRPSSAVIVAQRR